MKTILRVICAVLVVTFASTPVHAFWSLGLAKFQIHQNMTSKVLNARIYTFENASYAFSIDTINSINISHDIADDPNSYDGRDHFDSEKLDESVSLLKERRRQLMGILNGPRIDDFSIGQKTNVQLLLGLMLHQIQDFYSHSTWSMRGSNKAGIVNFGDLITTGNGGFFPLEGDAVCDPSGRTAKLPTFGVTTGHYPSSTTPGDRCRHGDVEHAGVGCAFFPILPDGINRDHPCFLFSVDIEDHKEAIRRAKEETISFVQSIVSDLEIAGNAEGFCALLGLNPHCVGLSLAVGIGPEGGGRVRSEPPGIDCPDTCLAQFEEGTTVTLIPVADPASVFVRWTGACVGGSLEGCTVTMDGALLEGALLPNVTAIFGPRHCPTFDLGFYVTGTFTASYSSTITDFPDKCIVEMIFDNAGFPYSYYWEFVEGTFIYEKFINGAFSRITEFSAPLLSSTGVFQSVRLTQSGFNNNVLTGITEWSAPLQDASGAWQSVPSKNSSFCSNGVISSFQEYSTPIQTTSGFWESTLIRETLRNCDGTLIAVITF